MANPRRDSPVVEDDHRKELPGAEVDKDQRFLMRDLWRWGVYIATGLAAVCVMFIVAGWIWPDSSTLSTRTGTGTTTAQINNNCPGGANRLGQNWTSVEKNGCRVIYLVLRGSAMIHTADNREYRAPAPGIWNSDEITAIRLIDGEAYWAHCPRHTIGYQVNWDCSRVR